MHILRCMNSKFSVKFEPINRKIGISRGFKVWRIIISQSYDILSFSETGVLSQGLAKSRE